MSWEQREFNIHAGLTDLVVVITILIMFKIVMMILQYSGVNLVNSEKNRNVNRAIWMLRHIRLVMKIIFFVWVSITVVGVIGVFVSEVSLNTIFVFLLILPIWRIIINDIEHLSNQLERVQ
jgi:hypothetical protein